MSHSAPAADLLAIQLKDLARQQGFPLVGIAPAARPDTLSFLQTWLDSGCHGEMSYMERRRNAYEHPEHVQRGVRSVVMLGATYDPPQPAQQSQARIAAYAQGTVDYHHVLRDRIRPLADWLKAQVPGSHARIAVDTAPLLERDFARTAGLGWFGKNTMLINKHLGSFFFLAALLTDVPLKPDPPHDHQHCGTCTRCLDVCPTGALPEPYLLDARRCISYLTIELRGQPIPEEFRHHMGEWVFGCDLCQEVCPWNRKAPAASQPEFRRLEQWANLAIEEWFFVSEPEFEELIANTPLTRTGRAGLLKNAAIVLANHPGPRTQEALNRGLSEQDVVVQEACRWALTQMDG